jgi:hypothetical protein
MRFTVQINNAPASSPLSFDSFSVAVPVTDWSLGKRFQFTDAGMEYFSIGSGQLIPVTGTERIGEGAWTTVEIRVDYDGNTLVYVQDELVDTITSSDIVDSAVDGAELMWETNGTTSATTYLTRLTDLMIVDTIADPFIGQPIQALVDYRFVQTSGTLQQVLLMSAGDYIYHDRALSGVWRPLKTKEYQNVHFAPFRQSMLWVEQADSGPSSLWEWDGSPTAPPEVRPNAPRCSFAVEHQGRGWAAGDRTHPLRAYFSADRQLDSWFVPGRAYTGDRFSTVLDAGYLEVPSRKGDEIVAIYGDYYNSLLLFTRTGCWRVTGSGINSYAIETVSQDVGAVNQDSVALVGNDLWFMSNRGIHSLQATDKFGDMQTAFVSSHIQDLWGYDPSTVLPISQDYIHKGRLKQFHSQNLVYVAVPLSGDTEAEKVYVYNNVTQQWYGPWTIDSRTMESVDLGSPTVEVMIHGDGEGRVGHTAFSKKSDMENASYTSTIQTATFNGRSIDPELAHYPKSWKRLRLHVLPRGNWDIDISWKVDAADTQTRSINQNVYGTTAIDNDFRLSLDPDARLHSREELGVIEIPLDASRGKGITFTLAQTGALQDMVIQGIEVDFVPHGYEESD